MDSALRPRDIQARIRAGESPADVADAAGVPIERIAAITGMAEGTVKSHLFRGKQKLTAFLRQNGYS